MCLPIYKSLSLNYYLDEVRFKSTIIRNYTYAKKGGMVQTQKHPYTSEDCKTERKIFVAEFSKDIYHNNRLRRLYIYFQNGYDETFIQT